MNPKCIRLAAPLLLVGMLSAASALAGGPPPKCETPLDTPTIQCLSATPTSITIRVCAGPSGAPAGVSIHWKLLSEYNVNGWAATGSYACISLGGNCGGSLWSLGPNQCRDITINAGTVINEGALTCGVSSDCTLYDLQCDTDYIFRIFAHEDPGPSGCPKSCKAGDPGCPAQPVVCRTAPCPVEGECTLTWGYWKTHGPAGCNPSGHQPNAWPAGTQKVGCLDLDWAALCSILQTNPSACGKGVGSNAVLILEHQLIAAEFNRATGAIVCAFADQAIAAANNLLCGHENDCIGASSTLGQQMLAVKDALEAYNSDQCACPVPNAKTPGLGGATEAKPVSWGTLKVIYR